MNRTMASALFVALGAQIILTGRLSAEPVPIPLVVGSVRDQHGYPVARARVRGAQASGLTGDDGTFALAASNVTAVTVSCDFCRTQTFAVAAGTPVVAIVRRYGALLSERPSAEDVASLPYGHVESILALQPFAMLEDSQNVVPGPRISDRGLAAQGGLILDEGIPNYDIAANVATFATTPSFDAVGVEAASPLDAFRYGDQAGGGTFVTRTKGEDAHDARAIAGSEAAARYAANDGSFVWAIAGSNTGLESRRRADAFKTFLTGDDDAIALNVVDARGALQTSFGSGVAESFSGLRATYERVREKTFHAALVADRGSYAATRRGAPFGGAWTDLSGQAGIATVGPLQSFADAGFRASTGFYDAGASGIPRVAAATGLVRADAGLRFTNARYDVSAGAGVFHIAYDGGAFGFVEPMQAAIVTPSLHAIARVSPALAIDVGSATTFRLPTFLEAYGYGGGDPQLHLGRQSLQMGTLQYSDWRRFRAQMMVAHARATGLDVGTIDSSGFDLAWQVAPNVSLRAWDMFVVDSTRPYEPLPRFGARPQPARVGSAWLTYETEAGFRLDAIYRSDLIDYRPDRHIDASVSSPLTADTRWFIGTERRHGARFVDFGIRFSR